MNLALQEGLKELGRIAVIAVLPILIASLEAGSINWAVVGVAAAVVVLKAVDKYVHKNDDIAQNGIVPF